MDKKIKNYVIIGIIVVILISISAKKVTDIFSEPPVPKTDWQEEYRLKLVENNINLQYTSAQRAIDYLTPQLQEVINSIDATGPEDALKKTTKYVLSNIRYSSDGITPNYCFSETATSTYLSGVGDCVSMTKLGTAILRGQGIAVKTTGGCLKFGGGCMPIMGTVPIPIRKADIWDGKKRGWLHEWAEVYLPDKGWVTVDFTNGAIYEKECQDYVFYSYDNADYKDICVIEDYNFIDYCRIL